MDLKRIKGSEFVLGDAVEKLQEYEEEQVHLVCTSPPYFNQREEYATYKDLNDYLDKMGLIYRECIRLLKPGCIFAMNIGQDISVDLPGETSRLLRLLGMQYIDTIVWDKGGEIGTRGIFLEKCLYYPNYQWEPIYIYQKPPKHYGGNQYSGEDFPQFEASDLPYITSVLRTNVWKVIPEKGSWHPAPYPKQLASNIIKCYTKHNQIVLDPFGGSGTTAKVAEDLGRKYLLTERDPNYYEQAIKDINSQNLSLLL